MKKILYTISAIIYANMAFAQVVSDCTTPAVLYSVYKEDVASLAIERMFECKSGDTNQIVIPQPWMDTIWRGLSGIFNAKEIPERDSVFDLFCIHEYDTLVCQGIIVGVDPGFVWTQNWANLQTITGIATLDSLLSTCGFKVIDFNNSNFAFLVTDQIINIFPLLDSLKTFEGITDATPGGNYGSGSKIEYSISGNQQSFGFILGWMDCPAGCIYSYTWNFDHLISATVPDDFTAPRKNSLPSRVRASSIQI